MTLFEALQETDRMEFIYSKKDPLKLSLGTFNWKTLFRDITVKSESLLGFRNSINIEDIHTFQLHFKEI